MQDAQIIIKFDKEVLKRFKKVSLLVGALLIIAGLMGIIVPQIMAIVVNAFFGWLLFFGGLMGLYLVFLSAGRSFITWLKPILLLITGLMFLLLPDVGISTLTLLLAFYLLLDAYGNLGLSFELKQHKFRGLIALNGVISFLLALLILFLWTSQSAFILGLFAGISLLFDGIVIFMIGLYAHKSFS